MKKRMRALRFAGLVVLIFLACFGIGIAGGVPFSFSKRKQEVDNEVRTEYVEKPEQHSKRRDNLFRPG